jgi:alginate O-acetyltransferase complex protein AlgJ
VVSPFDQQHGRTQAIAFLAFMATLLFSFLADPGITPSSLAQDFRWRKDLIRAITMFRFGVGDRIFNNTVVGKDGWLFYSGGLSFREYQRTDPLGQSSLRALQKDLDRLNSTLAGQGKSFLLVIPPNKTSIYAQYMPDQIPVIGSESRLDQFVAYMKGHGETQVLDLRPALVAASSAQPTYFRTDSHWNDLGAYYGYAAIIRALSAAYPNLTARPLLDFDLTAIAGGEATDLPATMGYLPIREEAQELVPRFPNQTTTVSLPTSDGTLIRISTNQQSGSPRLLVFGDSFYSGLAKFIEPDFSRVTMLSYRVGTGGSLQEWIRRENPDIVIIECVERSLEELFPLLEDSH